MRAPSGRGFINKSVVSAGALPVLRRVTASTAFSVDNKMFSIEKEESEDTSGETGEGINDDEGILQTESLRVEKLSDVDAAKNLQIPWRINFSLNYSLDRNDINNINQRIDMGTTV